MSPFLKPQYITDRKIQSHLSQCNSWIKWFSDRLSSVKGVHAQPTMECMRMFGGATHARRELIIIPNYIIGFTSKTQMWGHLSTSWVIYKELPDNHCLDSVIKLVLGIPPRTRIISNYRNSSHSALCKEIMVFELNIGMRNSTSRNNEQIRTNIEQ